MDRLIETGVGPEFLLSEANGSRSRENIIIAASQTLKAGAVLGRVTVGGQYVIHDPGASNGSQNAAAILYDAVTTGVGETADAVGITRDAEVIGARLTWDDHTAPQKTAAIAQLAAIGIIVRL